MRQARAFISFVVFVKKISDFRALLQHLTETATDPTSFEVMACVHSEEALIVRNIQSMRSCHPFEIKTVKNHSAKGLCLSFRELTDGNQNSPIYFFCIIHEGMRFLTTGWDTILATYINYQEDHIFRLKISKNKYRNYTTLQESLVHSDGCPIVTRKWLEITGGFIADVHPSAWHEGINYYLGLYKDSRYPAGISRSLPISLIDVTGDEESIEPHHLAEQDRLTMARLAARLRLHIEAFERQAVSFFLKEYPDKKETWLMQGSTKKIICKVKYILDPKALRIRYLLKQHVKYSLFKLLSPRWSQALIDKSKALIQNL